jgi:type IV pilus assembly protein PilP
MGRNQGELKTFLAYFASGAAGLAVAAFVATAVVRRSHAQVPPPVQTPPATPPKIQPSPGVQTADPNLALPPSVPSSEPPPSAEPPKSATNIQEPSGKNLLEGIIEDFNYEVSGRRDPFLPYTSPKAVSVDEEEEIVSPLQRFDLDQLKLVGIIWHTKKPKALFLDPAGKGYIVGKLDKIGRNRGYIAEIREGEVIVLERYVGEGRSTFQTRSIRLERE